MKLRMASLLKKYGVDIKVWSVTQLNPGKVPVIAGIPQEKRTEDLEPELRHDPIVPYNEFTQSWMNASGGSQSHGDLMWYSTGLYKEGTIVEIPSQGGKYTVTDVKNLLDYSDVVAYQLKGDDHHQQNI